MQGHAVVFTAPNQVAYQTMELPEPGPRDVVVSVTHSWISPGTEGSFLRHERINGETSPRPGDPLPFPMVAGYQKVGRVTSVGAEVHDIAPGEVVFATVSRVSGCFWPTGGHVSPAITPRDQIWKLPPGLDPLAFSGLVLTQVGYNCGTRAPAAVGDVAVVMGDGLVGQWAAQTLAWRGAQVIMLGHRPERLAMWQAAQAHTVNTREGEALAAVKTLAPDGVWVIVDTVGDVPTIESLLPVLRHDGHVVSAGFNGERGRIDIQKLRFSEASLHCPSGWNKLRMDQTLTLIAQGKLTTLPLITHRFPASQARAAWDAIRNPQANTLGVILEWEQ
ncbi:MAG: zinc-binding dehydrogenase [Anaerolineae bacterium]